MYVQVVGSVNMHYFSRSQPLQNLALIKLKLGSKFTVSYISSERFSSEKLFREAKSIGRILNIDI